MSSIEDGAFEGCNDLYSITLPSSIKFIGKNAFGRNLDVVTCHAQNVPNTDKEAFSGKSVDEAGPVGSDNTLPTEVHNCPTTLYVPAESVEAYRKSEPWSKIKNILPIQKK